MNNEQENEDYLEVSFKITGRQNTTNLISFLANLTAGLGLNSDKENHAIANDRHLHPNHPTAASKQLEASSTIPVDVTAETTVEIDLADQVAASVNKGKTKAK
ncbi:MAG: hypothetical protein WBB28_01535 [Crinalium sp.]